MSCFAISILVHKSLIILGSVTCGQIRHSPTFMERMLGAVPGERGGHTSGWKNPKCTWNNNVKLRLDNALHYPAGKTKNLGWFVETMMVTSKKCNIRVIFNDMCNRTKYITRKHNPHKYETTIKLQKAILTTKIHKYLDNGKTFPSPATNSKFDSSDLPVLQGSN